MKIAWNILLKIKESIDKMNSIESSVFMINTNEHQNVRRNTSSKRVSISIDFSEKPDQSNKSADVQIVSEDAFHCKVTYNKPVEDLFKEIFELYLPYALLSQYSRINNKTYVVSHFAQSIDGRIATSKGSSKWIGNRHNLIHAHRMRALLDGILIGSGTVRSDNPQLTVRHVKGMNPYKIILGGCDLNPTGIKALKGQHLQFCRSKNGSGKNFTNLELIEPDVILKKLYNEKILTLYLEGGSVTTSSFLQSGSVDQVQVHFAPLIIGSGITGFNFPGIDDINQAIKFKSFRFIPVGDQIMFTGEL